jgi:hypothetical protein
VEEMQRRTEEFGMKKIQLFGSVAAMAMLAASAVFAEDDTGYSDDVNWDIQATTERTNLRDDGGTVGDITAPSYNPNTLRPAGDGFGHHQATRDIEMQGNSVTGVNEITGVSRIVGNGVLVIENLDMPSDSFDAANKVYVDNMIAEMAEDVDDVSESVDNLTGGDGIDRDGTVFNVDETVVRTYGDQNISGVKNFQTRINVTSTSTRPLDSRSSAAGGAGVYGRSTSSELGYGVVGMGDGDGSVGVFGVALGDNGRAGNFETTGDDANGIYALNTGQDGYAAQFRTQEDADATVAVIGWEDGDRLMVFGVDQSSGSFTASGEIYQDGDGIRITGVTEPTAGADAVNKDYVDQLIASLEQQIADLEVGSGDPAEASYVDISAGITWQNSGTAQSNLYYYYCARNTVNSDGTSSCEEYGIKSPVKPGQHRLNLYESNITLVYNLSMEVSGSCELGDVIGYDTEVPFYGDTLSAQEARDDGEAAVAVLFTEHTPASWGFAPGDITYGAGSITDGCTVKGILDVSSPDDSTLSRRYNMVIHDTSVTPMPSGYTIVDPG